MNWFWLIVGLLVGWLVEWVIDWIYWRRGSSDNAAELENLRAQNRRLRADLDAATGSVNKIKAEAADVNGKLSAALSDGGTLRADNARLQAELQALRDSAASQTDASAELTRLRARMNVVKGAAASLDDQVNALVSERDALKGENERLHAQFSAGASAAAAGSNQFATQQLSSAEVQSALELERLRAENERLQAELSALYSRPRRDPLIDINGIGPVIEKRLFEAGIFTFEQLAEESPEHLREIARLQSWQEADPAAWIVEARERAAQKSGS